MYSRNSGGFSSNVSDSISLTMRRPSEMYFFSSRHDWIGSISTEVVDMKVRKDTYMLVELE